VAPRRSGLFVVGTDTGVGKTVVTAALVHALRAHGRDVGVYKPVQSGQLADDPAGDAATLVRLGDVAATPGEVCGYAFARPLAPLVAARREGRAVEVGAVLERVRELQARFETLLVEGAGGLLVPLGEGLTVADLAGRLGFPLAVVARPGLGTVNHTALTVAVARARGLVVAGVVLNGCHEGLDESVADNPALIEEIANVSVIGRTPWLDGELTASRIRAAVAPAIDVLPLLRALEGIG
jgi:dethiobiotin synthetase